MSILTNDIDNAIQEIKEVPAKPKRAYRKKQVQPIPSTEVQPVATKTGI